MKVKKSVKSPEPQYPSHRQLSDCKTLVGIAAIGLGAISGLSGPPRTAGVPVQTNDNPVAKPQPANTNCQPGKVVPMRTGGVVAAEPRSLPGEIRVVPAQATNRQDCVFYTIKKGDTLASIASHFFGNSNSCQEIRKANPDMTPDSLKVGQVIAIPMATATNNVVSPRLKGVMPVQRH